MKKNIVKVLEKLAELDLIRPFEQNIILSAHQKDVAELQRFKNATVGLYAIDFNPKELIERFVNSQSDACSLFTEDIDRLIEDWERWINDENIEKNPFHQIN